MSLAVFADKAPFVRTVRCRTVANTLSIGFDVRDGPTEHWDHLRTSNPIEGVFATVRHRAVRTAKTAKLMVFKLVNAAAKTWRRLKGENHLPKVVQGPIFQNRMGAIGYVFSYQAIFLASAALAIPLMMSLARIHPADVHHGRACGQPDHHEPTPPPRASRRSLWQNPGLLTFAICLFLFQFANASMLPLAGEALAYRGGTNASFVISAMIIVPQILVVLAAPWVGREAQSWGRRPLLLIGFVP